MQKTIKIQLNRLKSIGMIVVLAVSVFIIGNKVLAQENGSAEYLNLEREIINQLNQERVSRDLKPLQFSSKLKIGAEIKLNDLIKNKYFAHTSPSGIKAWDILADIGYDYKYAGENLAMKFSDAVSVHNAWMKSKTHRENILFKDYTEVAVAVGERSSGSLVAVEFFGKPMSEVNGVNKKNEILIPDMEKNIRDKKIESNTDLLGDEEEEQKQEQDDKINKDKMITVGQIDNNKNIGGTGNLLTQIIPEKQDEKNIRDIMSSTLSSDQIISLNNMILLGIGMICLILVVNIWVLEKEDERILAEAKKLCSAKEELVMNN